MSPRAACRLATLGFKQVYDYSPGKVDWLAHGLPVDGTHAQRPTAGSLARQDVATCTLDTSIADALEAIVGSAYGFALVVSSGGVLIGRVVRSTLETTPKNEAVEGILEPGPSTIRPHLTPEELRHRLEGSDVRTLVVTRPDGTLIGVVRRDDVMG
jgi:Mg/Co/Ni transporter MgtE